MTAIRPDIDPELSAVIDRALAKAPEDRFKDLAEMRRSLHRIRTRLEESEPSTSQTTIVLNPKLQAVVKQARQALEADDPSAAVPSSEGARIRIEQGRPALHRAIAGGGAGAAGRKALERRARDEGAARGRHRERESRVRARRYHAWRFAGSTSSSLRSSSWKPAARLPVPRRW